MLCPCAAGFLVYEWFRTQMKRLQSDGAVQARAAALRVVLASPGR